MAVLHGEEAFCVTDFPKVKFSASEKFPWIHQSEQKNYPWQFSEKVLLVNKNLRRLNQSREIETYRKVQITCCLSAEFVLAPNLTAKPQQDFERCCEWFSVFYTFTLVSFLYMCSRIISSWSRCKHFCKPVLLTSERELVFLKEKWSQRLPFKSQKLNFSF